MICPVVGCQAHYGCRLRAKGILLSPAATPTATRRGQFRPAVRDSYAGADARDERGVRVIRPNGTPVSVKEFSEQKHQITDAWAHTDAAGLNRS